MAANITEISPTMVDDNTTIIVINGFLSETNINVKEWVNTLPKHNKQSKICHLDWEASNISKVLYKIGRNRLAFFAMTSWIPGIGWVNIAKTGFDMNSIVRQWKTSLDKTIEAGIALANQIDKEDGNYIILGHSLGARVIYHALTNVKRIDRVKSVCLLGGAVSVDEQWSNILDRNEHLQMFNLFSKKDWVLKFLYKAGTESSNNPVGSSAIKDNRVRNLNVSKMVSSHMKYKESHIGEYLLNHDFGYIPPDIAS